MSELQIYEKDTMGSAPGWRWRVKAGNGEIVASGEGYTTERDCKRGFLDARDAMNEAFESLRNHLRNQKEG